MYTSFEGYINDAVLAKFHKVLICKYLIDNKMFFSKLLLIVTLCHMVLNGESLDNNGDSCDKSQAKTVRLQGLTKYAGRAEICWNMDNDEYRWFNVCSYSWSMSKTRDICEQLNYFNTIIGELPV